MALFAKWRSALAQLFTAKPPLVVDGASAESFDQALTAAELQPASPEVQDRLLTRANDRFAIEQLGRKLARTPDDLQIVAELAELLCERMELEEARPFLLRLVSSNASSLRAHLLLADADERRGDLTSARRHLELILAEDFDYPMARVKLERLSTRGAPRSMMTANASGPTPTTLIGLPNEGAAVSGRFRLLHEIGRGGAGAVYEAEELPLDRQVAIKILHPHLRGGNRNSDGDRDGDGTRDLERTRAWAEARLQAAIRHPGVLAIYDLDEQRQLIAMELCRGGSLRDLLRHGPVSVERATATARNLARTLDAVHRHGILHGDVKPANLLYRTALDELPVLGDFGLARLLPKVGAELSALKLVGTRLQGTLAYMAPELLRPRDEAPPSTASDFYSLGAILLEMLVGEGVFSSAFGDNSARLRGEARWDHSLPDPLAGGALESLLAALLSPTSADRPTAEQIFAALPPVGRDAS